MKGAGSIFMIAAAELGEREGGAVALLTKRKRNIISFISLLLLAYKTCKHLTTNQLSNNTHIHKQKSNWHEGRSLARLLVLMFLSFPI